MADHVLKITIQIIEKTTKTTKTTNTNNENTLDDRTMNNERTIHSMQKFERDISNC